MDQLVCHFVGLSESEAGSTLFSALNISHDNALHKIVLNQWFQPIILCGDTSNEDMMLVIRFHYEGRNASMNSEWVAFIIQLKKQLK